MDKHFEPVTARSLAEKIVYTVRKFHPWQSIQAQKDIVEHIIEPHIRKPSDGEFINQATYLLQRCALSGSSLTSGYKLPADLREEIKRFFKGEYINTEEDKSVPARCEEAYNEALSLLHEAADVPHPDADGVRTSFGRKVFKFLQKPNPFHEADIVHEDETGPTKVPFSLELAAQGHKVVTRDGREAKVVADNLYGEHPIACVVTDKNGCKDLYWYTDGGHRLITGETDEDLFILKEPETVEIGLYRHKFDNSVIAHNIDSPWNSDAVGKPEESELIKTIKTTI